jgi:2-polyprenyl-3-methyl-5-hydroxy-6-metoxy-1,4-benzoquinol methylase
MDLVEKNKNQITNQRHPWEEVRFEFFLKKIRKYVDLKTENYILDVGCGDAYFIAKLNEIYPNLICIGVDINFSEHDIQKLKQIHSKSKFELFNSIKKAREHVPRIDLILLMDVIEHIENDVDFLLYDIAPIVEKNNAIVFITVPAYQKLFTKHDVFLGHYRRYNNALLLSAIQKGNLAKIEVGYFFSSLIGLRILEKVVDKINPSRNIDGLANWNAGTFTSKLVYNMLLFDNKLSLFFERMKIKLPGLSNYIICKKITINE